MFAAPDALGIWGETRAMMQQPANLAAASGSALVGLVIAETQARMKDLVKEEQHAWKRDRAGYRTKTLAACTSAARALAKIAPGEALA
jgi:hypothetical protein